MKIEFVKCNGRWSGGDAGNRPKIKFKKKRFHSQSYQLPNFLKRIPRNLAHKIYKL